MRTSLAAWLEVIAVFSLFHVGFRSFRAFTSWGAWEMEQGFVFSPGILAIVGTLLLVVARRGNASEYGLVLGEGRRDIALGLNAMLIGLVVGGVLIALGVESNPRAMGATDGVFLLAANLAIALLFVWCGRERLGFGSRFATYLFGGLVVGPVLIAALSGSDRSSGSVAVEVIWRVFAASLGEEILFRGYIQSRVDQASQRRWIVRGVSLGPGIIASSVLFGLVHGLNPVDYFSSSPGTFAWGHALATLGPLYGILRAMTGSILAPFVLHALLNLVVLYR